MRPDDTDDIGSVDPGADANDFHAPPDDGRRNGGGGGELIASPRSTSDFIPSGPRGLIDEMQAMQKEEPVWQQCLPLLDAIAGATPPLNGPGKWDHAKLIFTVQELAQANGYTLLARANAAEISRAFTHAYKRNTGQRLGALIAQGKQLRLEYKQAAE